MCEAIHFPLLAPREKAVSRQSLICLLQGLEGMKTTVELRNENTVTGLILHVDAYMCITMKNVLFSSPAGNRMSFSDFFVHGTNVRYVHIPDEVNISKTIEYSCNKEKRVLAHLKKEHDQRVAARQKAMERKRKQLQKTQQAEGNFGP